MRARTLRLACCSGISMYLARRGCAAIVSSSRWRDAIRIGSRGSAPIAGLRRRQPFEQLRQAVAQAQIFAIGSRVLADQRHFAHACSGQIFRFAHDGFKSAAAEFSAQLRNDAERAGMIAALGDLDVRGVPRRGENARRQVVIEVRRQGWPPLRRTRNSPSTAARIFSISPVPTTASTSGICSRMSVAVALHQASGDDQFFGRAEFLVFGHFQNRVDRFLLRRLDEAARVDDEDFGFFGARREFVAVARENAHHHLAIHEVFRATQRNESDLGHGAKMRTGATF